MGGSMTFVSFSWLLLLGAAHVRMCIAAPCDILSEAVFNTVAPFAENGGYTYSGFCTAVTNWNAANPTNQIFQGSTEMQQRHELAAFLGNTLHESNGFRALRETLWCADNIVDNGVTYCKPCDSSNFLWGSDICNESLVSDTKSVSPYCTPSLTPSSTVRGCSCQEQSQDPSHPGYVRADKLFIGRGSIQLSWNYNYYDASVALTSSANTFCDNPDLVATNEAYAWGVGIYFWMTNAGGNSITSHTSVLTNEDFGGTVKSINGGLECPGSGWHVGAVKSRLNRYCKAATELGVDSLLALDNCDGLKTAFDECTSPGANPSCEDCIEWTQSTSPTKSPTKKPTTLPTRAPTNAPSVPPTKEPTSSPTKKPTALPTTSPTREPTKSPHPPTVSPTTSPTAPPTYPPTKSPLPPTVSPTTSPTAPPTYPPTKSPHPPTVSPTTAPTTPPTMEPTKSPLPPTISPTTSPTAPPTYPPTKAPTYPPTYSPTKSPTKPTPPPTYPPTSPPTYPPTKSPTKPTPPPTYPPTTSPTYSPTTSPIKKPDGLYYPNWGGTEHICINDGAEPNYMKANPTVYLYPTLEACCQKYYQWNYDQCVEEGGGGGVVTTQAPPAGLYYPDWSGADATCLNDGGEPEYMKQNPTSFMHETLELCCAHNYGWMYSACMGTAQTGEPKWYASYTHYKCIQDCVGGAPCGGYADTWNALYESASECCKQKLFWLPTCEADSLSASV